MGQRWVNPGLGPGTFPSPQNLLSLLGKNGISCLRELEIEGGVWCVFGMGRQVQKAHPNSLQVEAQLHSHAQILTFRDARVSRNFRDHFAS